MKICMQKLKNALSLIILSITLLTTHQPRLKSYQEFASEHFSEHSEGYAFNLLGK